MPDLRGSGSNGSSEKHSAADPSDTMSMSSAAAVLDFVVVVVDPMKQKQDM